MFDRRNGWKRRGDECLNLHLGSWGVVPEVLEISQLGHDVAEVAEHLVEHGVLISTCSLLVQRLVSILGRFDTVLIEPTVTLVVEQVDNEIQPILLELSSSIENSRDLDQHQRFGVACTRQASGMVHIVRKVTVQRSGSLGFCRIDSTRFWYLLNSVSLCHNFLQIKLRKADSVDHLWRRCRLCSQHAASAFLSLASTSANFDTNSTFSSLAFINLSSNKLSGSFPAFGAPAPAASPSNRT